MKIMMGLRFTCRTGAGVISSSAICDGRFAINVSVSVHAGDRTRLTLRGGFVRAAQIQPDCSLHENIQHFKGRSRALVGNDPENTRNLLLVERDDRMSGVKTDWIRLDEALFYYGPTGSRHRIWTRFCTHFRRDGFVAGIIRACYVLTLSGAIEGLCKSGSS